MKNFIRTLILLIVLGIFVWICIGFYNYKIKYIPVSEESTFPEGELTDPVVSADETEEENNENNEILQKILPKIDFPTYAIASIYNEENFTTDNISNAMVLRLGWSKLQESNKNLEETKSTSQVKVEDTDLKESIENIFGKKLKYKDVTFVNVDLPIFKGDAKNPGRVVYSNGVYSTATAAITNGEKPFIHQEVNKVIKIGNSIKVYVTTAFVDTTYNKATGKYTYTIYSTLKNGKLLGKVTDMTPDKFGGEASEHGKITQTKNEALFDYGEDLNSYVYTFKLDEDTQEYYLAEFAKAQ